MFVLVTPFLTQERLSCLFVKKLNRYIYILRNGDFTNIHDTDKNNDQTENSNFLITKSYVTIDPTILSEVTAEITIPSMQSS